MNTHPENDNDGGGGNSNNNNDDDGIEGDFRIGAKADVHNAKCGKNVNKHRNKYFEFGFWIALQMVIIAIDDGVAKTPKRL